MGSSHTKVVTNTPSYSRARPWPSHLPARAHSPSIKWWAFPGREHSGAGPPFSWVWWPEVFHCSAAASSRSRRPHRRLPTDRRHPDHILFKEHFMKDGTSAVREVTKVVTCHHQTQGGGFVVRRPLPTPGLEMADPFLLIDEMGPVEYAPGEAIGAPDHPHRGFETVTYVLDGEMEHEDSAGHRGVLHPGDVQWMTAGAGIVHSEMPSGRMREQGGRVHGFQVWVNLPARLKMTRPRYQEISAASIPEAPSQAGKPPAPLIPAHSLAALPA